MNTRRFKVVVTDFIADALEPERKALGDIAEVTALDARHEDELAGHVEDADALMVYHNISVTRKTIERLARCKLINRCGVGFDNVDWRFARERGIPVTHVPDYGTEDVADTALAMMLALARGTHFLNSRLRAGIGPWLYTQAAPLRRLRGCVFGIVGMGRIGTATALRAKAFGMDVVFYDPYVPDGRDKSVGVRRALEFDDLLREAHVLSMHCPLTDETRGMINAAAIAKLPRGAYLVNTARGAIVDTAAVADAIASGQLGGAGLDVLPAEPPPDNDPLIT
ncbi:MAG: C-terminal binding protein, partial [Verrucomicrobiae bacterium]|nr:C-terminal binding protein [Verrucomicrobiae bacterium]